MNEHEKNINAFIVPTKRARFLSLMATKKGRSKLRARLNHNHDFDRQCLQEIPPAKHSLTAVLELLRERGAPRDCYVISANSETDGREMDLQKALSATIGRGCGTVISCIPGQLAYFEAEDPGERYLLLRGRFPA